MATPLADLVAEQQRQACELAWNALNAGLPDDSVMTWFITEQIGFPMKWAAYVWMALIDTNKKSGMHRWREARSPFGLIRTIAWRAAFNWRPDLIFHTEVDLVARAHGERSMGEIRRRNDDDGTPMSDQECYDIHQYWQDERSGENSGPGNEDGWWFGDAKDHDSVILQACRILDFDEDEQQVVVWRYIHRLSRRDLEGYWDERRVWRVWRRVTDKFEQSDFRVRFVRALRTAVDSHRAAYSWARN